jgi:hypothetical protein
MKKLFLFILLLLSWFSLFSQYDNDLSLEKPIINFNEPLGGFYSEYSANDLDSMYCGAVVKNVGTSEATNVYLEVYLYDYTTNLLDTYHSDSISQIAIGQSDTIHLFGFIPELSQSTTIVYSIESDFIDENENNNIDTLPIIDFFYNDWISISRTKSFNDSINIREIEGIQSGDFIGIKVKTYNQHLVFLIDLPCSEVWTSEMAANAVVYDGEALINSVSANVSPNNLNATINHWTDSDHEYIYGFEFIFANDDDLYIHVDTASYHNFQYETVAFIGGEWTSLDFVPAIRLICDPENIEGPNLKNDVDIFPSPTTDYLFIRGLDEIESLEFFNLGGVQVMTSNDELKGEMIDLRGLIKGVYILKIRTPEGIFVKKITKL